MVRLAVMLLMLRPALLPAQQPSFAAVDAHVAATPREATQSVSALAGYLVRSGSDDLTRARAVFRWVADNINYDVAAFRSGTITDVSPEGVLRSRASVCEGYSRLSEALGRAMGLEIVVVAGWSKGYGYRMGETFEGQRPNHAWNAVRIGGSWRLMDATWGAGYLDAQMRFVRRIQEHYFLTPPEAFINDHLPEDPAWQLLPRRISGAEYVNLPYLRPGFFTAGLRVGSHPNVRIEADGASPLLVHLGASRPVQLMVQLLGADGAQISSDQLAFAQVVDSTAEIRAVFPSAGEYLLRVFAKPAGAAGEYDWALDYRVRAARGSPGATLPLAFTSFLSSGGRIFGPWEGTLRAGQTYRFHLRAPGAQSVAVVVEGRWIHLARSGDDFAADVPAAAGTMVVFAFGGVTPVPIPNTEVKPASVDGTADDRRWESRPPPATLRSPHG
jgi:hypothetical protein